MRDAGAGPPCSGGPARQAGNGRGTRSEPAAVVSAHRTHRRRRATARQDPGLAVASGDLHQVRAALAAGGGGGVRSPGAAQGLGIVIHAAAALAAEGADDDEVAKRVDELWQHLDYGSNWYSARHRLAWTSLS